MNGRTLAVTCAVASLAVAAQGQPINYAGFTHTPLGDATLSVNALGYLELSNIGSSGLDGVRVAWTSPDAFRLRLGTVLQASDEPTGTMLAVSIEGAASGLFGSVTATDIGGVFDFVVDFTPMGSSTHTLRLLNGSGQVLLNLPGHSRGQNGTGQPETIASALLPDGNLCIMFMWDAANVITVPGEGTFTAAAMMMISEAPALEHALPTEELYGNYNFLLEVAGSAPGPVVDETITMFRNTHRSLGGATLNAQTNGVLSVSNIGSSGQDGVQIDPPPGTFDLPHIGRTLQLDFDGALPDSPGGAITVQVWGEDPNEGDGTSNTILIGEVRAQQGSSALDLFASFAPIGVSSFDVELYREGALVGSALGLTNLVATLPAATMSDLASWQANYGATTGVGPVAYSVNIVRVQAAPVVLPGQNAIDSDRIKVTVQPTAPPGSQVKPSQTKVLLAGMTKADIINEVYKARFSPCQAADLNQSGDVNVLDLLIMLGAWGPNPGHMADLNGDGVVSVLDLLLMLGAWGAC